MRSLSAALAAAFLAIFIVESAAGGPGVWSRAVTIRPALPVDSGQRAPLVRGALGDGQACAESGAACSGPGARPSSGRPLRPPSSPLSHDVGGQVQGLGFPAAESPRAPEVPATIGPDEAAADGWAAAPPPVTSAGPVVDPVVRLHATRLSPLRAPPSLLLG